MTRLPTGRRFYKNPRENTVLQLARKKWRWNVSKRGWPDFIGINERGHPVAVEVKPPHERLTFAQTLTMAILDTHGIECYVWNEQDGLSGFLLDVHGNTLGIDPAVFDRLAAGGLRGRRARGLLLDAFMVAKSGLRPMPPKGADVTPESIEAWQSAKEFSDAEGWAETNGEVDW